MLPKNEDPLLYPETRMMSFLSGLGDKLNAGSGERSKDLNIDACLWSREILKRSSAAPLAEELLRNRREALKKLHTKAAINFITLMMMIQRSEFSILR